MRWVNVVAFALALGTDIASSNDQFVEENRTGWAFYLDNDLLTTGDRDQDYTGGVAVTLSGAAATTVPLSVDGWLTGLNRFSRFQEVYADRDYFQRHNFEFGFTLFTPRDILVAEPLPDDHPYASLFFISNTQQTILPESNTVYQSSLTVGFLGLKVADDVQELIHSASGSDEAKGWGNQISSGGEPTAKYGVSRQKTHFQRERRHGLRGEFKTSLEANIGFSTDATMGLSWRWGRISTPWWSFNPHQAEYINLGAPVAAATASNGRKEFYVWAGASLKYRFYNAILQGQFRDSEVTFKRSELEHLIAEVWIGVTNELNNGLSASVFIRGRTKEISGFRGRAPVWGGVILSRAF